MPSHISRLGRKHSVFNVAQMLLMLTFRAEVNRVYSDCQSQFLLKVFTAWVVKRTPIINQEIFFRCLEKKKGSVQSVQVRK